MIAYRPPTPADGPELDAMARAIWVETFAHSASPENIALYLDQAYGPTGTLIRDLADPAVRFRIAIDDGAIVGYAKLTAPFVPEPELRDGAVQLSQLYVASSHHGAGIADALMRWAIDTARDDGAEAMILTVWEGNERAKRFYQKRGFVHVGDFAFQTGNQIDRDLIMRLTL